MSVETGTVIANLDKSWPLAGDPLLEGDNHIRLIKAILKSQFPGSGGNGFNAVISVTEAELNRLAGLSSNAQDQISANATAASNAQSSADSAQATANTAVSDASTAQAAADNAQATADTAIADASTAQTAADNAQATADTNTTNKADKSYVDTELAKKAATKSTSTVFGGFKHTFSGGTLNLITV